MAGYRQVEPVLDVTRDTQFRPRGWIGERVTATEERWLIPAPSSNPGMVEMFARPVNLKSVNGPFAVFGDWRNPDPAPWAGEFAGKWLIAAVQSIKLTGNPRLHEVTNEVCAHLLATQAADGSLGLDLPWDVWNQYHVMLGLLRRYQQTGAPQLLTAVRRAADRLVSRYGGRTALLAQDFPAGDSEKNQAVLHVLLLLYEETGVESYLRLAEQIRDAWATSGDYLANALAGRDFFRGNRSRWESLHDVQALAELYLISGDARYRRAFEQIWHNLRALERHRDGGFGGSEGTTGDRDTPSYVETCATVAWMALSVDMLRISGVPAAADELELTLFNAMLAAQSPDGRVWTYQTPVGGAPLTPLGAEDMAAPLTPEVFLGYRLPTTYDLDWQQRERYPQLSCCAANGARGLGCLAEWAVMRADDGIAINFYGPSTTTVQAPDGTWVTIEQRTVYPLGGHIELRLDLRVPSAFVLRLRTPAWSASTSVSVGGAAQDCTPGTYCSIDRVWLPGDRVEIDLDLAVRFEDGTGRASGRVVAYRGPLLLTCDGRYETDPLAPPPIHREQPMAVTLDEGDTKVKATFRTTAAPMTLCDYASAWAFGAGRVTVPPDRSVPWQFTRSSWHVDRSRSEDLLAARILLHPDGTIAGYAHPNEARWGFEGDLLTFYASNGAASTRFTIREKRNGRHWLSGFSLLDPAIRHVLSEVDEGVAGKTWQFARRVGGIDSVILPRLATIQGGGFDRPTHPNENRWGHLGGDVVFARADGTVTTRFAAPQMVNGRVEYTGQFVDDPAITHVLTEIDPDVTTKAWRMWQLVPDREAKALDDKLRLLPGGRIDGHLHPNEARWSLDGDDILFQRADGAVTTRLAPRACRDGIMLFEGVFELNRAITHRLEERAVGWPLTPGYVSWLPVASDPRGHDRLRPHRPPLGPG